MKGPDVEAGLWHPHEMGVARATAPSQLRVGGGERIVEPNEGESTPSGRARLAATRMTGLKVGSQPRVAPIGLARPACSVTVAVSPVCSLCIVASHRVLRAAETNGTASTTRRANSDLMKRPSPGNTRLCPGLRGSNLSDLL